MTYSATPGLEQAIQAFGDYVRNETLAVSLQPVEGLSSAEAIEDAFDGERLVLLIARADPEA